MMTADFSRGLPDLRAGVYRHWKGHFYMVLGYAHDANADEFLHTYSPSGDGLDRTPTQTFPDGRAVVVYMGLELTDANTGPRLAVRTAEDFFALVCSICGAYWECATPHPGVPVRQIEPVPRFEYMGPAWYGWSVDPDAVSGTRPAPDTPAAAPGDPTDAERPQPWSPCGVSMPHEPHGPDAPRPRCPGVPPRHKVNTTDRYDGDMPDPPDPFADDEDPPAAYAEGTESGGCS